MILDLRRFVEHERPYWEELEKTLSQVESDVAHVFDFHTLQRFYYLYQRASSGLARVKNVTTDPQLWEYLEGLVTRSYGEIHEVRQRSHRLAALHWLFVTFPQTFRRHLWAFAMAAAATFLGALFGAAAIALDSNAKEALAPFPAVLGEPSERVAEEERAIDDRLAGFRSYFSAVLLTNNVRVAILTLALGMTWGVGTLLILFYNGIILGAVSLDYVLAGHTSFLLGWLLPHGVIEIPAILIAGQAGLLLARALIGWGSPYGVKSRLRKAGPDLVTLIFGVGLLLVWAAGVEAFFSQYHEPVVPYSLKIGFGFLELILLGLFLSFSGLRRASQAQ